MIQIKSGMQDVVDKKKWQARGAVFVTKLKATKAIWFGPGPASVGKKAGATARKTTSGAAKRTTSAAKRTTSGAKKTASARKKS